MELLRLGADICAGWCVWSLSHNLGHRWWHDEMLHGKKTFYAHGEREHHRIYDRHGQNQFHVAEDPKELFISFPVWLIAVVALLFVALYGWLCGWPHAGPFAATLYISMVLDHQLHILFHKKVRLAGLLGRFQEMHLIHHATHNKNYFFVSGLLWDVLFRTAVLHRVIPTATDHEPPLIQTAGQWYASSSATAKTVSAIAISSAPAPARRDPPIEPASRVSRTPYPEIFIR